MQDGCYPDYATLRTFLNRGGRGASVNEAFVALGLIRNQCLELDAELLLDYRATGCISQLPCSGVAEIVVGVLARSPSPVLVGAIRDEMEDIKGSLIIDDGEDVIEEPFDFRVRCIRTRPELIAAVDSTALLTAPTASVRFALEKRLLAGARRGPHTFACTEPLADELRAAPRDIAQLAIDTMAQVLLRPPRPRGLQEHALRVGPGPTDAQIVSKTLGRAYRCEVQAHGAGWRLHYWRGKEKILFANLVQHQSFALCEGPELLDRWPIDEALDAG